jgi:hypothetical protein
VGVRILAHITGTVDQELLLRNEYLIAENRIPQGRLRLPNAGGLGSARLAFDGDARLSTT